MDNAIAVVAGVMVGGLALLVLQAVRRSSPVPSPTDAHPANPASNQLGSLMANLGGGPHVGRTISRSRSVIRSDRDGTVADIDGVTYRRLGDVPEHARALLLDELRVLRDSPNLPDGALAGLDQFVADDGTLDLPRT